ncbi:MAG: hypothetical protein KDE27_07370, partial [Planctomycetes bacterium]|nr:hypothetical protein [Planctomycetota bacterium]
RAAAERRRTNRWLVPTIVSVVGLAALLVAWRFLTDKPDFTPPWADAPASGSDAPPAVLGVYDFDRSRWPAEAAPPFDEAAFRAPALSLELRSGGQARLLTGPDSNRRELAAGSWTGNDGVIEVEIGNDVLRGGVVSAAGIEFDGEAGRRVAFARRPSGR